MLIFVDNQQSTTLFFVWSNVFIVLSLLFGNISFILDQNSLGLLWLPVSLLLLFYRIYTIL